jgi:hypothetical protein
MSGIEPDTSDTTQLSKRLTPVSLAIADREDLFSIRLNPNSNIQHYPSTMQPINLLMLHCRNTDRPGGHPHRGRTPLSNLSALL